MEETVGIDSRSMTHRKKRASGRLPRSADSSALIFPLFLLSTDTYRTANEPCSFRRLNGRSWMTSGAVDPRILGCRRSSEATKARNVEDLTAAISAINNSLGSTRWTITSLNRDPDVSRTTRTEDYKYLSSIYDGQKILNMGFRFQN